MKGNNSYICPEMNKGIQQFTVIYLALIILIRMMAMPISLVEYSLNKNFIAANLCENRLKQAVHCAGSCFLSKKLANASESQEAPDQKGSSKTVVIDFFESVEQLSFGCHFLTAEHSSFNRAQQISDPFRDHLLRPPIV
jgi:hypothetical protein